jgi:large subunit ribosomal protein L6e
MVKKFAWYPADDEQKHYKKTPKVKIAKLRKSITPGTVLVLLAGRFRGRRVVFLKQLGSGLLLVTGPYKVNGVPLKRVNQAYTLSTTTKVDIKGIDASKIEDTLFKREKKAKKAGEEKFFAESKEVRTYTSICIAPDAARLRDRSTSYDIMLALHTEF